MTRGSYSTPSSREPVYIRSARTPTEPRTYVWRHYGSAGSMSIDPSHYALPVLAAEFADKWLEIADETGHSMKELVTSVRAFLTHVANQPHLAGSMETFALVDLRRRHLDRWEIDLLKAHKTSGTDTKYRYAVYLFALLARIHRDAPDALHPEVVHRLESGTRLQHRRNEGLPAFAPREVRQMRSRAHRLVYGHLTPGTEDKARPAPSPAVLTAAHILVSLATGEPPEVIRSLTVDQVIATAKPEHDRSLHGLAPAARLAWLAERDLVEQYAVTWTKNRAGQIYQDVYTRRDHAAHRTLTAVIRLTAGLRERSHLGALWLQERTDGQITEPVWNSETFRISRWNRQAGLEVSEPQIWGRFRKTVVAGEALADPYRYLNSGRRHGAQTFFRHYTNSDVLRAEAGRLLIDSVDSMFKAALTGPTVITPEAEQLLSQGLQAPNLDAATTAALLGGDLDGPHTACRNPQDSPFEEPGVTCTKSMTGTCFGCPNALITRHHLPAALAIVEVADPVRAADPEIWIEHWKPIYETITEIILPSFPPEAVEEARGRIHSVSLGLGVLNDMRGTDDPT